MKIDIKDYNKHFNGLTEKEFLSSESIKGFYKKDLELGDRPNYSGKNLRVSLLDICNEKCFFCYNEGMIIKNRSSASRLS